MLKWISASCLKVWILFNADKRGSQYELPGPAVRKWPRCPRMLHMLCVSRQYHYLAVVQINPLRTNPSHSATETRSFRFSVKIFSRSAHAGG
jgi:hypothetical protein